ncbi:MAG: class I SAM-dependent rRNA methyltransferase [Chthoniobacteraceae bacterium]
MAGIVIRPRSRILHGHDWVYSSEVLKAWGNPQPGGVIVIKDGKDRMLGSAIYNPKSQIVARRFSRQRQELDADFFLRRIRQAIAYRERRGLDTRLARLVWSESDGLPGLIVDRYGDHVVLQTLTLAMDQRTGLIAETLKSLLSPASIIARNDAPIRLAEGLELRTETLHGAEPPPFPIVSAGVEFEVDLLRGQKTGFYLDQTRNYALVASFAAGRRVLDCFANQGAFALACAKAGAASVQAVEISVDTCGLIRRNAERNRLAIEVVCENAFDFLKQAEAAASSAGERGRYDLIILDPPSFTKTKGKLEDALRGYKEIHLRALKLLGPDGLLATFCCSHHVTREHFLSAINEATVDAKKTLRQLATFSQAQDHPIIPTLPETEYLKGFLFELAPGR